MNAIEKDLIAWTKAKQRVNQHGVCGAPPADLRARLTDIEAGLFRRGLRLLRKEGKADARS